MDLALVLRTLGEDTLGEPCGVAAFDSTAAAGGLLTGELSAGRSQDGTEMRNGDAFTCCRKWTSVNQMF